MWLSGDGGLKERSNGSVYASALGRSMVAQKIRWVCCKQSATKLVRPTEKMFPSFSSLLERCMRSSVEEV